MSRAKIAVSILVFSILLFLSFFILFLFILLPSKATNSQNNERYNYQFTEVNPFSPEEHQKGFVRLPTPLEREEFFSYLNQETGSSTIISNYIDSNYECTGSCYCLKDVTATAARRLPASSSQVLIRGITILFSAFSVAMATKVAQQTFHDQCANKFSSVCLSENINSEVEKCEKSTSETETDNVIPLFRRFLCRGYCLGTYNNVQNQEVMEFVEILGEYREEFWKVGYEVFGRCEDITQELEVTITDIDDVFRSEGPLPRSVEDRQGVAMVKFAKEFQMFCSKVSLIRHEWMSQGLRAQEKARDVVFFKSFQENPEAVEHFKKLLGEERFNDLIRSRLIGRPYCYGSDGDPRESNFKNMRCVEITSNL